VKSEKADENIQMVVDQLLAKFPPQ